MDWRLGLGGCWKAEKMKGGLVCVIVKCEKGHEQTFAEKSTSRLVKGQKNGGAARGGLRVQKDNVLS